VYSRNKDESVINGDARDFPDVELEEGLFDGLSDDDEVRSVVPGPAPIKILGDALPP
jgi:hypothetical protein